MTLRSSLRRSRTLFGPSSGEERAIFVDKLCGSMTRASGAERQAIDLIVIYSDEIDRTDDVGECRDLTICAVAQHSRHSTAGSTEVYGGEMPGLRSKSNTGLMSGWCFRIGDLDPSTWAASLPP